MTPSVRCRGVAPETIATPTAQQLQQTSFAVYRSVGFRQRSRPALWLACDRGVWRCCDNPKEVGVTRKLRPRQLRILGGTGVCVVGILLALPCHASAQARFEVVHAFSDPPGSASSLSLQATDGKFYGIGHQGAPLYRNYVFSMTASGALTILHVFAGGSSDGEFPGRLIQAADGHFYGATFGGGAFNLGTVYRLTADGTFTIVHSFQVAPATARGVVPSSSRRMETSTAQPRRVVHSTSAPFTR
jgi:uncharacterized repeat protein (TIGR03803 family)